MDSDEEFARKLQEQYNRELDVASEQEKNDTLLAKKMGSQYHQLSDSDDDDDTPLVSHQLSDSEADNNSVVSHQLSDSEADNNPIVSHQLSDSDNDDTSAVLTNKDAGSSRTIEASPSSANKLNNINTQVKDKNNSSAPIKKDDKDGITSPKSERKIQASPSIVTKASKRLLPKCKYGSGCYRKNPIHLAEFYHPNKDASIGSPTNDDDAEPPKKKLKPSYVSSIEKKSTKPSSKGQSFPSHLKRSGPFNLFLNKSFSVKETHNDPLCLVLPDLLNPLLGEIVESLQLNFLIDLDLLMTCYSAAKVDNKPLLVMYGQMEGTPSKYPHLTCTMVNLPFLYGTHHSKMMIFQYTNGLRVVIHTANLVPDDWFEKTQGYWISPCFPPIESGRTPGLLEGESPTLFKRDLVEYLLSYKAPDLIRWSHIIKKYDFSACNAVFVGSSPGYHTGEARERWGHPKIRRLLKQHSVGWKTSAGLPIIAQCSSIGSLGKDARSWLCGELGVSLCGGNDSSGSLPSVQVVYPSEDDVRWSSQGYGGGSCCPYNSKTHAKQPWLSKHLHTWRSEARNRTKAIPHIKTYTRLSKSLSCAQYLLITSSNLSKAAWGQLQKQGSQLFIRSYEVGVLLLPKFVNKTDAFQLSGSDSIGPLLPYDLPLVPYKDGVLPWLIDTKKHTPDVLGNTYP